MNLHQTYPILVLTLLAGGCTTSPVRTSTFDPKSMIAIGAVYALPRTLVTVAVDFEYYAIERPPMEGEEARPTAAAVFIGLPADGEVSPVRISSSQVPDWNHAFQVVGKDDVLTAGNFTVEYEKDALIKSVNMESADKSSEVIANTLGAVLKVATFKSVELNEKATGIRFTLTTVVPASELFVTRRIFEKELATIVTTPDLRLKARYENVHSIAPPEITATFAADSGSPVVSDGIAKTAVREELKKNPSGIYYRVPIPRMLLVSLNSTTIGSDVMAVADSAPIGYMPVSGRRFTTAKTTLNFFQNTLGLQKVEKTHTSAAEAGTGALKTSIDSIKTTLDTMKEERATARTAAQEAELSDFTRRKALAQKKARLANLQDEKAKLETELTGQDVEDRATKQARLYSINEEIPGLIIEIEALEAGKPIGSSGASSG